MIKVLLTFAAIVCTVKCQILPGFESYLDTVCYGDHNSYLASCTNRVGGGSVIAIVDIMAGVNPTSIDCPGSFTETIDSSCCTTKDGDCTFTLVNEPVFTTWYNHCIGKEQCAKGGAGWTQSQCTDYSGTFSEYSQYMNMEYYCIESSKVHSIGNSVTATYSGELQFLKSDSYPSYIPASPKERRCSIEVDDCEARITIYTVHVELRDNSNEACYMKNISIIDGGDEDVLHCVNTAGISMRKSSSSYIVLQLLNSDSNDTGRFWFGFGASTNSANVEINCPEVQQKATCATTLKQTSTTSSTSTSSSTTSEISLSTSPRVSSTTSQDTTTQELSTSAITTLSPPSTSSNVSQSSTSTTMKQTSTTSSTSTMSPTTSTISVSTSSTHDVIGVSSTTSASTSTQKLPISEITSTSTNSKTSISDETVITTGTTEDTPVASDVIKEDQTVVALTIGISIVTVLILLLICGVAVNSCLVRKQIKKIDIELANMKQTPSDSNDQGDKSPSHLKSPTKAHKSKSPKSATSTRNRLTLHTKGNFKSKQGNGKKVKPTADTRHTSDQDMCPMRTNHIGKIKKMPSTNDRKKLDRKLYVLLKPNRKGTKIKSRNDIKPKDSCLDEERKLFEKRSIQKPHFKKPSNKNSKRRLSAIVKRSLKPDKNKSNKKALDRKVSLNSNKHIDGQLILYPESSALCELNNNVNGTETNKEHIEVESKAKFNAQIQKLSSNIKHLINVDQTYAIGQAICTETYETKSSVPCKTPKRKRYLKLYRVLSSALGYSWIYKEVPKKKKQQKNDNKQEMTETVNNDSLCQINEYTDECVMQAGTPPKVRGVANTASDTKYPLYTNVTADNVHPFQKVPSKPLKTDTIKTKTPTEKTRKRQKCQIGTKRVSPLSTEVNTFNMTKSKANKKVRSVQKQHWTDSVF